MHSNNSNNSNNPFTPIFGRIPPFMAGREHVLNDITTALDSDGNDPNLCTIFVGARGTGKTALLAYLSQEALAKGWVCANVSATSGMLEDILERALDSADAFVERKSSMRLKSLNIGQLFGAEWEYRDASSGNWRTRMNQLINTLNEHEIGLLITVDEVKANIDEMIQLATVFQHFVREERKVALLMAGLPSNVSALVSHESVSFLRRARTRKLGRIPDEAISVALRKTIENYGRFITEDALETAVAYICGFPYMLQVVGFRLWAASPNKKTIDLHDTQEALPLAMVDLKESVLDATYQELSDGDLAFLEAMLKDEQISRVSEIAERMHKSANYARVYKTRLVEQGIISEERRGYVAFELPFFKEYLEEKLC